MLSTRYAMTTRATARAITRTVIRIVGLAGVATAVLGTTLVGSASADPAVATPTITAGPSGTATVRTATFTYSSATNVNFKCSLDSTAAASYVPCPAAAGKTGTRSYSALVDGSHTFRVLAQVGTTQSVPAVRTWSIDATRPTVVSITRLDPSPRAFGTVRWQVTFSEPVVNVGLGNFSLAATGLGGSPALLGVTPNAGPATVYTVSATSGPGTSSSNATLRLDLPNTGTVRDAAGNTLNGVLTGATYVFDAEAPIVAVTKVNGAVATFPLVTASGVTSIGGTCGAAAGDAPTVTVLITGSLIRTDVVPCDAGVWSDSVALAAGSYSVTATQSDTAGNIGTSGAKAITVTTFVPALVSLTMINGSTIVNGSTIIFPLTTNVQLSSVGGSCAILPGSTATVSVSITGPTNRTGTAPCTSGIWTFALSPVLRNAPVGIDDGDYTITATQGNGSNVASTGPRLLTLATRTFTVSGSAVTQLRPGGVSDLNLTVTNPYGFALKIESLTVTFTGTSTCSGPANFAVARAFTGPVIVPAGSSVLAPAVAPQIRMLNLSTPQDNCKSTSVALTYSGMASRA